MKCQCGSEQGNDISGIGKKTGKPWTGWKCSKCSQIVFFNFQQPKQTQSPTQSPNSNQFKFQLDSIVAALTAIASTLGRIETILANPDKIHVSEEETEADTEVPF